MNTQNWLTLMEYSALYRVSLSTLRRRIKAGEIECKLIEGKYLLKNGPLPATTTAAASLAKPEPIAPPTLVSGQVPAKATVNVGSGSVPVDALRAPNVAGLPGGKPVQPTTAPVTAPNDDQFWKATQGLLNEIKKAYSLILQEKEEQILQLKEEVADLKTLVRVLEDDNTRLKKTLPSQDFDLGLEL